MTENAQLLSHFRTCNSSKLTIKFVKVHFVVQALHFKMFRLHVEWVLVRASSDKERSRPLVSCIKFEGLSATRNGNESLRNRIREEHFNRKSRLRFTFFC